MPYVVPLLIPVVFVLVAALCALALFSESPTVRRFAYRAVYGSCIGALILAGVVAWFFYARSAEPVTLSPRAVISPNVVKGSG